MSSAPTALVTDPLRLAALDRYAILDTPPEPGFDDLAHLAAQACAAPVALISLVDVDRQWFKARVGFPACETRLDSSVCKFVLGEADILTIADLAADPRTCANPLVTGAPHIRFYAGAPLRSPEDHVLGSLCIIDTVPRPAGLTAAQADTLRRFARQVVDQLELRRALAARDALLADQAKAQQERQTLAATQAVIAAAGGDIDRILDALLAGAMEAVPAAEAGVIELVDGDELIYGAVRGSNARFRGLRLPLRGSLAGHCVAINAPLLVADALADPHVKRDLIEPLGLRSIVIAPLARGDEVLGVLQLHSSRPDAFAARDLELTRLFAGAANAGLTEVREAAGRRTIAASEVRYRAIFESAIDYGIIVLDLDGRVTNWNSGATNILGWSVEEMLGRRADVFFTPEDRADRIADAEMRAALECGRGQDERWHLRKGGERFWASGEMMALRDKDGDAIGFVKILRDRTDQREIEERLRTADERLQMALNASGVVGLWDWMVDTDLLHGDANFARLYGLDIERTAAGLTMAEYQEHVVSQDLPALRERIRDTFDTGAAFLVEYRLDVPGHALRWVECKGRMSYNGEGKPVRFSGTAVDITKRKLIEAETRRLAAIVEQSGDFIGVAHLDGSVAWVNEAGRALVGLADAEGARQTFIRDYFDPADWDGIVATVFPAVDAEGRWRGELRFRHFITGALIPVIYDVIALRDAAGEVTAYATVTRDITLQKRHEAQQAMLHQELAHRLKNTLAMVQAIAAQTLRHASDPETARDILTDRLIALGKAHDLLMSGEGERAEMRVIIAKALELHDDRAIRRFHVAGPPVACGSKAALALALMIHELATNAVKYGALSTADGRVAISWALEGPADAATLTLVWQEQGGPAVSPPTRKGYGSRLIQRGLAGAVDGEVAMDYPPDGVVCTLTAPLAGFQNES